MTSPVALGRDGTGGEGGRACCLGDVVYVEFQAGDGGKEGGGRGGPDVHRARVPSGSGRISGVTLAPEAIIRTYTCPCGNKPHDVTAMQDQGGPALPKGTVPEHDRPGEGPPPRGRLAIPACSEEYDWSPAACFEYSHSVSVVTQNLSTCFCPGLALGDCNRRSLARGTHGKAMINSSRVPRTTSTTVNILR